MLKKIRTKRGFTIVEVMVAFVIFAIMSAMVATILQSTMLVKQENTDLEEDIENQKSRYYLNTQDKSYNTNDGTLQFDFDDIGAQVNIDYEVGSVSTATEEANNEIALEYYIGNVDYDATKSNSNNNNDENSKGSVTERLDSRIFGAKGIERIVLKVEDGGEGSNGGHIYKVSTLVSSSELVDTQYEQFASYRIVFPHNILSFGFIKNGAMQPESYALSMDFDLKRTSSKTMRIAARMPAGYNSYEKNNDNFKSLFQSPRTTSFWVELSDTMDISDLNKIFGTSSSDSTSNKSGDSYIFTPYKEIKEVDGIQVTTTHVNIFGAFVKEESDEGTAEAIAEATDEA